ncbi:hypothetical protein M885DRAFT_563678 [Pelagophyceae sp. CCMP2097]|nr:hypothetical protein M885DRAFT_563678 [Pelagophyceae sp. CCMP2097]
MASVFRLRRIVLPARESRATGLAYHAAVLEAKRRDDEGVDEAERAAREALSDHLAACSTSADVLNVFRLHDLDAANLAVAVGRLADLSQGSRGSGPRSADLLISAYDDAVIQALLGSVSASIRAGAWRGRGLADACIVAVLS